MHRSGLVAALVLLCACVTKSEHERAQDELKQRLAEREVALAELRGQVVHLSREVEELRRGLARTEEASAARGKASGALAAALDKNWEEAARLAEEAERKARTVGVEVQAGVAQAAAALRKEGQKAASGFAEALRKLAAEIEPKETDKGRQP